MMKQYYFQDIDCEATHIYAPNCICWHDQGTGPLPKIGPEDDDYTWRIKPTTLHWVTDRRPTKDDGHRGVVQILHEDGQVGRCLVNVANEMYRDLPWAHCPGWDARGTKINVLRAELEHWRSRIDETQKDLRTAQKEEEAVTQKLEALL